MTQQSAIHPMANVNVVRVMLSLMACVWVLSVQLNLLSPPKTNMDMLWDILCHHSMVIHPNWETFSTLISGQDEYPTNFDCEYQVTAPRTEGSCYEIHIEHPFSLETSRSCRNDRLEIFNILNAADISMDPAADDTTAVLCGNGKFYISVS